MTFRNIDMWFDMEDIEERGHKEKANLLYRCYLVRYITYDMNLSLQLKMAEQLAESKLSTWKGIFRFDAGKTEMNAVYYNYGASNKRFTVIVTEQGRIYYECDCKPCTYADHTEYFDFINKHYHYLGLEV